MKIKNPVIILKCIHLRLITNCDVYGRIGKREALAMFGELYHIPKEDRFKMLLELKDIGLVKEINPIDIVVNKHFKI
jgi:hypothetical protein